MLEKLKAVEDRYNEMAERAAQPDFYADPQAAAKLLREQRQLEPLMNAYRSYCKTQQEALDLREMLDGQLEEEMRQLCQEEYTQAKKDLEALEEELKILLLAPGPQ